MKNSSILANAVIFAGIIVASLASKDAEANRGRAVAAWLGGTTIVVTAVNKFNEFVQNVPTPRAEELLPAYCGRVTNLTQHVNSCQQRRAEIEAALSQSPQQGPAGADQRANGQELSQALRDVLQRQQQSGRQAEQSNQSTVACRDQLTALSNCLDAVDRLLAGSRPQPQQQQQQR